MLSRHDIMNSMNSLPDPQSKPPVSGGITSKEKTEVGMSSVEAPALREVGREVPLPSEVGAAGVKMHPSSVTLPQPVQQLGVKPTGDVSTPSAPTVALPLSDDQIATGLHQSITSSWRWLAEWCMRRLKQVHLLFKSIHGKIVRVKT